MPEGEKQECQSMHSQVKGCSGPAAYLLYSCARKVGLPVCAATIEDPLRGTIKRWTDRVDDGRNCLRCGRGVNICWSWIPI